MKSLAGRVVLLAVVTSLVSLLLTTLLTWGLVRLDSRHSVQVLHKELLHQEKVGGVGRVEDLLPATTRVVGAHEVVIVVVLPDGSTQGPGVLSPDLASSLKGRSTSSLRILEGREYLVLSAPYQGGGMVLLAPVTALQASSGVIVRHVLLAGGISLVVAVLLGLALARGLTRPIREAARVAQRMKEGERSERVSVEGPEEIAELSSSVNELADALSHSEERSRLFLRSISHELRTPLTPISAWSEALADGVLSGAEAEEAGRVIARESARLSRLVEDLLALARLEADDFPLALVRTNLVDVLEEVETAWSAVLPHLRQGGVEEAWVVVDPQRLRQAVDCLVENASRVAPEGEITLRLGREGDYAVMQVEDSGPGLSEEDLELVFEPGALHARSTDEHRGRAGVGLALAKSLVVRMGGMLTAEQGDGGAMFVLRFPLA